MRHMPVLAEVMTAFPVHVDEQMPLVKAAEVMREHGCHHLPVMDDANQVVGLLTTEELRLAETPGRTDHHRPRPLPAVRRKQLAAAIGQRR